MRSSPVRERQRRRARRGADGRDAVPKGATGRWPATPTSRAISARPMECRLSERG